MCSCVRTRKEGVKGKQAGKAGIDVPGAYGFVFLMWSLIFIPLSELLMYLGHLASFDSKHLPP